MPLLTDLKRLVKSEYTKEQLQELIDKYDQLNEHVGKYFKFPVMLRKMWSGNEVHAWLEERTDVFHMQQPDLDPYVYAATSAALGIPEYISIDDETFELYTLQSRVHAFISNANNSEISKELTFLQLFNILKELGDPTVILHLIKHGTDL